MKDFKITFLDDVQQRYNHHENTLQYFRDKNRKVDLVENRPWEDTLAYQGLEFSNHNFNAIWKSINDGRTFRMNSSEFNRICQAKADPSSVYTVNNRLMLFAKFSFVKRGDRIHLVVHEKA